MYSKSKGESPPPPPPKKKKQTDKQTNKHNKIKTMKLLMEDGGSHEIFI